MKEGLTRAIAPRTTREMVVAAAALTASTVARDEPMFSSAEDREGVLQLVGAIRRALAVASCSTCTS